MTHTRCLGDVMVGGLRADVRCSSVEQPLKTLHADTLWEGETID